MIPYKLTVRNFMCYRDDVPPLLFEGMHIACLSGDNGAGKSTLLDALTWALWGEARGKSDDDLIALGADDMEVDFEWQLAGDLYRVIRRRTKGKRTGLSIVELQIQGPDGAWRRISGDSVRDTNAQITDVLRMSYTTFINSSFLMQGRADEFTSSTPQARKQVLGDILGLADYERLEKQAKQKRDTAERHLRDCESLIADFSRRAEHLPLIQADVAAAEARVAAGQEEVATGDAALARLREKLQQLQLVAERQAAVQLQIGERMERQAELNRTITQLEAQVGAYRATVGQGAAIIARYDELQQQRLALVALDRRRDQAVELREQWREQRDIVNAAKAAVEAELGVALHDVASAEEQVANQTGYEARVAALRTGVERFAALQTELEATRVAEAHIAEQLSLADKMALEQSQYERTIEQARGEIEKILHSLEQTVERCQPQAAQAGSLAASLDEIGQRLANLDRQANTLIELRQVVAESERDEARLQEQMQTITRQGKEMKSKLEIAQLGGATCPVCHSELGIEGLQAVIDQYHAEQAQLRDALREARRANEAVLARLATERAAVVATEAALQQRSAVERKQATLLLQLQQAETARNEQATAQAQIATFNDQLERHAYAEAAHRQLAALHERLAALGDLPALQAARKEHRRTIAQYERDVRAAPQAQQALAEAEALLAQCRDAAGRLSSLRDKVDHLRQTLAAEDFAHDAQALRDAIKRQYDALAYSKDEHDALKGAVEQLAPAEQQFRDLQWAGDSLAREEQRLARDGASLAYENAQLETLRAELAAVTPLLGEQRTVEFGYREAETRLQRAQQMLENALRELGSAEAELKQCLDIIEQLGGYRQQAEHYTADRDLHAELTTAFGKKGLQAMLIDNALPEIEHETNLLLGRITDHQLHVSLDTQRDSKKGDTIETLDIRIADGLGTRDYAMYSGGEAFRVNFAIRIALSKLLAHRAGASLKTLVIDEGFGTQDGRGRERVIEAINAVADDFARVLVITHIQELKDQFPTQIEITKGTHGSSWRVAY